MAARNDVPKFGPPLPNPAVFEQVRFFLLNPFFN